jgi:hypothetical protein
MPLPSSQVASHSPSALLALLCASIVRAFDPSWLTGPVAALAKEVDIRPERVSRLWRKLLVAFEALLSRASTRGRKKRRKSARRKARGKGREALLSIAAEVIRGGGIKKRAVQDLIVAARDRMKTEHDIPHKEFCASLGLSQRTVRYWARRGTAPSKEPEIPAPEAPKKDRHVGRFDLAVTLPGHQAMADTSDFSLFDVPLKIVAVQDPGNRDKELWKSFAVDDHEDSEVVIGVVRDALADFPGTQLITDQGTPYLAKSAQEAYDAMELEHAPQKARTPTAKATLERSFLTVKSALAPLCGLTAKLAEAVPALKNTTLAKHLGRLLIATFLRVYAAAENSSGGERSDDPVVLEAVAERQREKGRAEPRSAKLLLESIFDRDQFEGSKKQFVKAHRRHHPDDVQEAERRLGWRACRCYAKVCDRYFTAILRNVAEAAAVRRKRERQERLDRNERHKRNVEAHAEREYFAANPEEWIARGLRLVATHYQPEKDALFNAGVGRGTGQIREALAELRAVSPTALIDRVEVGWRKWLNEDPLPAAVSLVREVLWQILEETLPAETAGQETAAVAILFPGPKPEEIQRPSAGLDLRFEPARSAET